MIIFHGRTQELECTIVSNGTMDVINQWDYKLQVIHVIHIYGPHSLWGLRITSSNLPKPQLICHESWKHRIAPQWRIGFRHPSSLPQSGGSIAHPALPKLVGSLFGYQLLFLIDTTYVVGDWGCCMIACPIPQRMFVATIAVAFACNFQRFVRWLSSWTMHRSQKASELEKGRGWRGLEPHGKSRYLWSATSFTIDAINSSWFTIKYKGFLNSSISNCRLCTHYGNHHLSSGSESHHRLQFSRAYNGRSNDRRLFLCFDSTELPVPVVQWLSGHLVGGCAIPKTCQWTTEFVEQRLLEAPVDTSNDVVFLCHRIELRLGTTTEGLRHGTLRVHTTSFGRWLSAIMNHHEVLKITSLGNHSWPW